MRQLLALVLCLGSSAFAGVVEDERIIMRGDANHSGIVDGADISTITSWLYSGGPAPPCVNEADVNRSGAVDVSDATYLANWLYQGGPAPPAPGPFNTYCTTTSPYISCAIGC